MDLVAIDFAREAAAFAATPEYEVDGFATAIDWLRFNCHLGLGVAANAVSVGRSLDVLSEAVAKVYGSKLGYAHLVELARTAEAVGTGFDERELLPAALESSPGKLHFLCKHYKHTKHPADVAAEEADLIEQRRLNLCSYPDGAIGVNGVLDPVGGAALQSALEPLARKQGSDDKRTQDRRMADALVELAAGGDVKATIQVTASIETLAGLAGAPAADVQNALPISTESLRQLACDCSITRVLLDSKSAVIDVAVDDSAACDLR